MIVSALLLSCAAAQAAPTAAPAPTTVILVRHAEKGDGDPRDPSLSPTGKERAGALADALEGLEVGTVIVSDMKRTRETAAPVAAARDLTPVEVSVAQGGEAHVKGVVAAVRAAAPGSVVLVVGHSNTLAPVIAALGGPKLPMLCEKQFATMFVLELGNGDSPNLETRSYGAADPLGAENCGP